MIIWFSHSFFWLIPIEGVVQYLSEHPIVLLGLILLLAAIVLSFLKKILKVAFLLLAIFIAVNAVVLHFADTEWGEKGKILLDEGTRRAEELVKEQGKKILHDGLKELESVGDSVVKRVENFADSTARIPSKRAGKDPAHSGKN